MPRHDESRDSTLSSTLILPRLALRQSCSIGLQVLQLAFLSFRTDDNCLFSFRFFFLRRFEALSLSLFFFLLEPTSIFTFILASRQEKNVFSNLKR